ncbi:PA14 domain-containing protein [Streptomyces sp. NPDC089919]|uniref:fibronectin type III domain-containing protein n=1 Tax=Streptomyces sp. NPDC089919 TaxID=3155188 RepID=UPI0034299C5F
MRAACATSLAGISLGGLLAFPTAAAAVTCAAPVWKAQFFADTTFSGTPAHTACDPVIDEDYGTGDPGGVRLPVDGFGVRWSLTRDFGSGGPFTFTSRAQDGVRVYLDGVRTIDAWSDVSRSRTASAKVTVPAGRHTLRVDFAARTGRADIRFGYAPRTSPDVDEVAPLAPARPVARYDDATGKAALTWAASPELDLAGYHVYRRPAGGTAWTRLTAGPRTVPSYTDAVPGTAAAYSYEVRAVDKAGHVSPGSPDAKVTPDRTPPAVPVGLTAEGTTAGNLVRWTPGTDGVHHYRVWAAPLGQQDPDGPQTVTGASYGDVSAPAGTPYVYRVEAVDAAGNVSAAAVAGPVTRPEPSAVGVPSELDAERADSDTFLTWDRSPDSVVGHRVYRRTTAYGGWTRIASLTSRAGSYEDRTAPAGGSDYYVVAVDPSGAESAPTPWLSVHRAAAASPIPTLAPRVTLGAPYKPCTPTDCTGHGGPGVAAKFTLRPAADETPGKVGRYAWRVFNDTYETPWNAITDPSFSWTPPAKGGYWVEVWTIGHYGTVGASTTFDFVVG